MEQEGRLTGVKDRLDGIHPRGLQLAHLRAGLVRRFWHAEKLLLQLLPVDSDSGREIFGAVAAFRGEHWAADEQITHQPLAGASLRAKLQRRVQSVAYAPHSRHATVEVRSQVVAHRLLRIVPGGVV